MDPHQLEQLKLVSEYIKFHIGLYLATPPVLTIIAQGLKVENSRWWLVGVCVMILIYLVSGMSAAWFMGTYINKKWDKALLDSFAAEAYSTRRRFMHHWMYWIGLFIGLVGLFGAVEAHYRLLH